MSVQKRHLADVLRKLRKEDLERFLLSQWFTCEHTKEDHYALWRSSRDGSEVILPLNRDAPDYPRAVGSVVEAFAIEPLTFDDVLVQISYGACDVNRYRIDDFDRAWGSVSLMAGQDSLQGLADLVRFTAAGLLTERRHYTGVPDGARELAQACRLGQTEIGSFTLKLYCPVNPLQIADAASSEENSIPFGRQVLQACAENLEFIAREDALDPDVIPPATLNANVAAAVAKLGPAAEFAQGSFSTNYVQYTGAPEPVEPVVVSVDGGSFQRAALVELRLKESAAYEQETLYGYITDLHKDPPKRNHPINHELKVVCQVPGVGERVIRVPVLKRQYDKAVLWNRDGRQVALTAVIDKRTGAWRVHQVQSLSVVPQTPGSNLWKR